MPPTRDVAFCTRAPNKSILPCPPTMIQTNVAVAVATANDRGEGGGRASRFTTSSAFRRQHRSSLIWRWYLMARRMPLIFASTSTPGWWILKVSRPFHSMKKYESRTKSMLRWVFYMTDYVGHGMSSNLRLTTSRKAKCSMCLQSMYGSFLYGSTVLYLGMSKFEQVWAKMSKFEQLWASVIKVSKFE